MNRCRVAITGLGMLSPLGLGLKQNWAALVEGQSGVRRLPENYHQLPVQFAGTIPDFSLSEELLSAKEQARYDRFIHFALQTAHEAFAQSGLNLSNPFYKAEQMGCLLGIGMGGFPLIEKNHEQYLEKGGRRVSPFFIPGVIPNMASGLLTMKYQLHGINLSVASACASSCHAIGLAANEIALGRQKLMLTGGAEAVITPLTISGFANMKALSRRNDEPEKASRPFDSERDGFVLGEGAGLLVLENLEDAKKRGATILAEVAGVGASSDAYHITAPHPEGKGAKLAIEQALRDARLSPEDVDYVNAHGTSTPVGDRAETVVLKEIFGKHADSLSVSSSKSMMGHLLGAAGGVESIICVQTLRTGVIPPTINQDSPDPECDLDYTPNVAKEKSVSVALNNSFGFGGTNSALIFKKYIDGESP